MPDLDMLGIEEAQLKTKFPDVKQVARPQLGPRGERGRWVASGTILFGIPFETIFYIKSGQIVRIEKLRTETSLGCGESIAADGIFEKLQAQYGRGQVSNSLMEDTSVPLVAVWVVDGIQISLHTDVTPTKCSTRLIFQHRIVKDGSEL